MTSTNPNAAVDLVHGRKVAAANREHRELLRHTLLDEVAELKARGLNSLQIAKQLRIPHKDANVLYAEAVISRYA